MNSLEADAELLLVYAAADKDGIIEISRDVTRSVPRIETASYDFVRKDTAKEYARWKEALDELVKKEMVSDWDGDRCYMVTKRGYRYVKSVAEKEVFDTSKAPWEHIGT